MINKDLKKKKRINNLEFWTLNLSFSFFRHVSPPNSEVEPTCLLALLLFFLVMLHPLAELRLQPRIGCLWPSFLQCVDRLYERRHRRWTERLRTGRNRLLMSRANLVERISRFSPTSAGLYSPHPVINTDRFTSLSPRRPRKARLRRGTLKGPKDAIVQWHRNGKKDNSHFSLCIKFPGLFKTCTCLGCMLLLWQESITTQRSSNFLHLCSLSSVSEGKGNDKSQGRITIHKKWTKEDRWIFAIMWKICESLCYALGL